MKTPLEMIQDINSEIIEATSLLEVIYRHSNENPETDCAIACLLRSLYHTSENADKYTEILNEREKEKYRTK